MADAGAVLAATAGTGESNRPRSNFSVDEFADVMVDVEVAAGEGSEGMAVAALLDAVATTPAGR